MKINKIKHFYFPPKRMCQDKLKIANRYTPSKTSCIGINRSVLFMTNKLTAEIVYKDTRRASLYSTVLLTAARRGTVVTLPLLK